MKQQKKPRGKKRIVRGALVTTFACAVLAVLGGFSGAGCGGDDGSKVVKVPQGGGDGGIVQNASGAQVGTYEPPAEQSGLSGAARDAYDKGWRAWLAGDLQGAKSGFNEAIMKDAKSHASHYSLAAVLERLGDRSGAQQEYRASFSVKSDYEPGMCAYALSLAHAGRTGEGDTFLTDKHQKLPKSARITTCLAEVKSLANDSGTAQQLAQDALRIEPDYKDAMVTIARDHYRARRMDLAKYALQAILDGFGESSPPRDPQNAEAHLLRGLIEREEGLRILAMKDFEAARSRRPDMVEAIIQTGAMKLEAGNVAEALPLLEGAVRYAPVNPLAHLNLGDAYRLAGRPTEAKKEFDTALSQDSSLAVTHYDLGLLYLFSPNVPGMNAASQVSTAIHELETYKQMKGVKPTPGQTDDVDELLSRAKAKQAEMKNAAGVAATAGPAAGKTGKDAGAPPKK